VADRTDQNPYACGDGACVLLVPGAPVGMHTNGGCRCIVAIMHPSTRVRLRQGILWLAVQVGDSLKEDACEE